jgi:hypothetical protein
LSTPCVLAAVVLVATGAFVLASGIAVAEILDEVMDSGPRECGPRRDVARLPRRALAIPTS